MIETRDRAAPTPRQTEIINRTMELVRVGGLGGLTTRKIAERVGFTEAALFRHFPSKQALLIALMDRLDEILVAPIRTIAGDLDLPAAERLERMVRHHTRVVLEHDSLPILLLAEASASGDPALVDRMRSTFELYLTLLEGVVKDGQDQGELIGLLEPGCMALLLLGAPTALAIRHRLLPDTAAENPVEASLIPFLRTIIETPGGRAS